MKIDDFLLREEEMEYTLSGKEWIWGVTGLRFISYQKGKDGEVYRFRDINIEQVFSIELDTEKESIEKGREGIKIAALGFLITLGGIILATQIDNTAFSIGTIALGVLMTVGGVFWLQNRRETWNEYTLRIKGQGPLSDTGWKLEVEKKDEEEVRRFIHGVRRAIRKL